jgi:hypothetical protein
MNEKIEHRKQFYLNAWTPEELETTARSYLPLRAGLSPNDYATELSHYWYYINFVFPARIL